MPSESIHVLELLLLLCIVIRRTTNGNQAYEITYSALQSKYSTYFPVIQNMINSIEFDDKPRTDNKLTDYLNIHSSSTTDFEGLGLSLEYPKQWKYESSLIGYAIFRAPFADESQKTPSWHETSYTMAIAVDSPQHAAVTDYRVIIKRSLTGGTWKWIRQLFEVSAHDKSRLLEQEKNYDSFHDKDLPYVLFYFNLNKVNFPQQYRAVFYITDYFVEAHHLCRLVDITNWIIIPPPEFAISITPNSPITLRPGERTNAELLIKGNTHLRSEASLANIANKELNVTFMPNKVPIPPSGTGVSNLDIKALDNAKPEPSYSVPISANISFPNEITNRGGEIFTNSKKETLPLPSSSNLTITVLPAYTWTDHINNFVSTVITPTTQMWTLAAAVVTGAVVIARWFISQYGKKKKNKIIDEY
jgi:hypothetical protein